MINARFLFYICIKVIVIIAFLNPVSAFGGLRSFWQKRVLLHQIDLCNQSSYNEIIPGLYLSNERTATDINALRDLKITHVLTIAAHRLPRSIFEDTNITTLFIRAEDHPKTDILRLLPISNAFIEEGLQHGKVLVHCHFGVSRSATLVIAYIMQKHKMTYENAFERVRQRRKFINPNPGFVNQLKEYERLEYDVGGLGTFESYFQNAKKHKYKIASFAALAVGILVPVAVMAFLQVPVLFL